MRPVGKRVLSGVVAAVLAVVALGVWLVLAPVVRHDGEAREVGDDLERVLTMVGAPPERVTSRLGDAPRGANGGHCWYFATATVRTTLSPADLAAKVEATLAREPLWWGLSGQPRVREPGVLEVTAEALGEGGTLDPRCG